MMSAGVLASCNENEPQPSGLLRISESAIVVGSNPTNTADVTRDVALSGITGELSVSVENSVADWCSASASATAADGTAKLTVSLKAYSGNADRVAFINVASGVDALTLKITQSGVAKSVKMIVVNEGGLGNGLGALTAILYDGTSEFDIFRKVNNRPLGDVAQSISCIDGKYFVALNNSRKVEVVEPQTFKSIATINYDKEGKPRFIARINDHEAIVSDLGNQLVKIDTKSYKVVEYIPVSDPIEKLVVVGNKLFGRSATGLVVFDTANVTAAGARTIAFPDNIEQTAKLIVDKSNKLWVMTTTTDMTTWATSKTTLHRVDPATEKIERSITVPFATVAAENKGKIVGAPSYNRMDTDRSRDKIYVPFTKLIDVSKYGTVTTGLFIYVLDVDDDAFGADSFRNVSDTKMMYGMGVDPDGQTVYMCDCLDYTRQQGRLREYRADGQASSYMVGIYPRMVHFTEYDN